MRAFCGLIRIVCLLALLCGVVLLSACSRLFVPNVKTQLVELKPGQYTLDPDHTAVVFKIGHLGLSTFMGRFERVEARLDFDAAAIEQASLQAIIDMGSVNVNNAEFEDTLRGSSWFNVAQYPQAVFQSKSAQRTADNVVRFLGDLTFLGVTKEVALAVIFNGGATNRLTGRYTIGFEATSRFLRSDFGMDQYLGLVSDEVVIEVYAEFLRE